MNDFISLMNSIGSEDMKINPTILYNEGWMTRFLVLKSIEKGIKINSIDFTKIKEWTSEALISSPFIEAPDRWEGYTNTDIALGDFSVNYKESGKIAIDDNAQLFGVIEAKMKSKLAPGTTNADNYNQGSRNLACIAYNTFNINCDIFFAVACPEKEKYLEKIKEQINHDFMIQQIVARFNMYDDTFKESFHMSGVISKAKKCHVDIITYENWIGKFEGNEKASLSSFYEKALSWNRIT